MGFPEFSVVVPASTANLGPGFDSAGLALSLYMTVHVSPSDAWKVSYEDAGFENLASGAENLIVTTVNDVANRHGRQAPCAALSVQSDIPLGKGLGSSAAAIAAGIEIANHLLSLDLSSYEKVRIGSELEGHADNVSAALLGGVTISHYDGEEIDLVHVPEAKMGAVILVPPKALRTEESRGLLPGQLRHEEATRSSAAGSVWAAAVVQDDWETAGRMMDKDMFHEPYRKALFSEFDAIRKACRDIGAYGMTISGAGPSLFVAVKQGTETDIAKQLAEQFSYYACLAVQASTVGAIVKE